MNLVMYPTPTVPAIPSTFSDDFSSYGVMAGLPAPYSENPVSGSNNWSVTASEQLRVLSTAGQSYAIRNGVFSSAGTFRATITFQVGGTSEAGLMINYANTGTHTRVLLNRGAGIFELRHYDSGLNTQETTPFTFVTSQAYEVEAIFSPNNLTANLYIGVTLAASVSSTDATPTGQQVGMAAIGSNSDTVFDNLILS